MSKENVAAVSAFVEGAPPGEVCPLIQPLERFTDESNLLPAHRCDIWYALSVNEPISVYANQSIDIKALTPEEPKLLQSAAPAFEKYNEEQLTAVKLPGGSQSVSQEALGIRRSAVDQEQVLVSSHNSLGGGRYYDVESQSSFAFDHITQVPSAHHLPDPTDANTAVESLLHPVSHVGIQTQRPVVSSSPRPPTTSALN